jgi:hypothetical protein
LGNTQQQPQLNSYLKTKAWRKLICITTLAFTASLVGCGADGILPGQNEAPENPNPFDIILGNY